MGGSRCMSLCDFVIRIHSLRCIQLCSALHPRDNLIHAEGGRTRGLARSTKCSASLTQLDVSMNLGCMYGRDRRDQGRVWDANNVPDSACPLS